MGKHFGIAVGFALIAAASISTKTVAAPEDYAKQTRELLSTVKTSMISAWLIRPTEISALRSVTRH